MNFAPEKQYSMERQELITTAASWHPAPKPQNPTQEKSRSYSRLFTCRSTRLMNSRSQTGSNNYMGTSVNTESWTCLHVFNIVEGLN